MAKDYQLKGKNFCGLSCVDQESVIHPETCIDNTLMACESNESFSLKNWILGSASPERELKGSLFEWLQNYYSGNVAFTLEPATASTLGGIKVGQYLNINNGILSVNRDSLNIPNSYELPAASRTWDKEIEEAYYPYNLGGVNIFNEWMGRENLTDEKGISIYPYIQDPEDPSSIASCGQITWDIDNTTKTAHFISPIKYLDDQCTIPDFPENDISYYLFPVDIIKGGLNDNCLVVNIPWDMFNQPVVRYDINQGLDNNAKQQARTNIGAGTSSFSGNYNDLTNKPSLAAVATSGNYSDLDGRPFVPTTNNERTINGPIYNDNTWSWEELNTITEITYTGNPVVNLGEISEGGVTINTVEGALSILLAADCKIYNITLYIDKCSAGDITLGDGIRLNCFRNTINFTYTISDDKYQFVFNDDITRIDLFKEDNTITLYISGYTNYTGEA